MVLAYSGKTFKTRIGRCDDCLKILAEFTRLESIGALDLKPKAATLFEQMTNRRRDVVNQEAHSRALVAIKKADASKSIERRIQQLINGKRLIDDLRIYYPNEQYIAALLEDMQRRIDLTIQR